MLTDAEFFCAMNSSVQWELEVETSTRSCTIIPLETTNFSRLIALQCKLLRGARSVSYRRKPFSVPATKTLQEFLLGDYPTATGYPLWVTWIGSLTLAVQNVGASVALRAISLDHFSHEGKSIWLPPLCRHVEQSMLPGLERPHAVWEALTRVSCEDGENSG